MSGHGVRYATVRDAGDVLHIECRFETGEKYAAIHVDSGKPDLAYWIARNLVSEAQLEATQIRLIAAEFAKDFLARQLEGIHALLGPPPIEVNGVRMEFRDPNAAETLAELSARIRAIRVAVAAEMSA